MRRVASTRGQRKCNSYKGKRLGGGVVSPHKGRSFLSAHLINKAYHDTVMMSTSPGGNAAQACIACRKNKRKCGRELPGCALCTRLAKHCQYTEAAVASPSSQSLQEQISQLQSELSSLRDTVSERRSASQVSSSTSSPNAVTPRDAFPPVFLLDTSAFSSTRYNVMKMTVQLPSAYDTAISSFADCQNIIDAHFEGVHTWFPIGMHPVGMLARPHANWEQYLRNAWQWRSLEESGLKMQILHCWS